MTTKKNKLKQLDRKELIELGKKSPKKLIIRQKLKKDDIVKILEDNITNGYIEKYLKERRTTSGLKANLDGTKYEDKIMTHFSKKGYKCIKNRKKKRQYEIDIIGVKKEGHIRKKREQIIVECKNRDINSNDVIKLSGKVQLYKNKYPNDTVKGWLVYSGIADSGAKATARNYKSISLKRIPNR